MFDFANILLAGPCNRSCPFCIGRRLPDSVNEANLDRFPPAGLEALVDAVNAHRVREVVLTGTTTDPQLYRHEGRLIRLLRERLHAGARLSVHTNGARALAKMVVFNAYDRACLSIPSLEPDVYERMMGSRRVPDLGAILRAATIPVKVSCVVNEHNAAGLAGFLAACRRLGVRRVVVRRLFGDARDWPVPPGLARVGDFRGNAVYDLDGMEVTWWDFDAAGLRSLNLFADGTLGTSYLLARTPELAPV